MCGTAQRHTCCLPSQATGPSCAPLAGCRTTTPRHANTSCAPDKLQDGTGGRFAATSSVVFAELGARDDFCRLLLQLLEHVVVGGAAQEARGAAQPGARRGRAAQPGVRRSERRGSAQRHARGRHAVRRSATRAEERGVRCSIGTSRARTRHNRRHPRALLDRLILDRQRQSGCARDLAEPSVPLSGPLRARGARVGSMGRQESSALSAFVARRPPRGPAAPSPRVLGGTNARAMTAALAWLLPPQQPPSAAAAARRRSVAALRERAVVGAIAGAFAGAFVNGALVRASPAALRAALASSLR